ncbi:MAG: tetraacyldisaccharide 4'-kinase [Rhodocyclaceae bacterium]|jgi:tetraacyldisaccharide 4'-kinase|nr:tetraacyldisaccharide 4'-kinase [Rhodocyclaceae bacterium]MCL4759710.1 tetraacyldisaccharide 4'-kinase [Rhodocyclaceae bacterium]
MPASRPGFWQSRSLPAFSLLPLAASFGAIVAMRRALYRSGLLRSCRLPVPVIVVGNIAVGGSGKTPVVAWLADLLRSAGHVPGIVSRGYGGRNRAEIMVDAASDPGRCGDEPVLLARMTGCPVAVGRDRPRAARLLLAHVPSCSVIIADDGLQHYRLQRDIEIAVVDEAVLGNGWLLPAGPLREPLNRLGSVDVLIVHGRPPDRLCALAGAVPAFGMRLEGAELQRLGDPGERLVLDALGGQRVHAVAGIGHPERFFDQLRAAGLQVVPHPFPDHHPFTASDLDFAPGETKILTAKDAVKCASFAPADCWVLPVTARIEPGAEPFILEKLAHGRPPA